MKILEEEYEREGFSLIVVYGRRRIGKTRLLMEWAKNKRGVYYVAAQLSYEQLSREFSELVGLNLGIWVPQDIVEAIEKLASMEEKLLVILDEFQYIVEADPTLPSRLQRLVDQKLSKTRIKLVLSGSAISFFEKQLLGYKSPLFGRRTRTLKLGQIRIVDAYEFMSNMDTGEALKTYMVLGGTPAYLKVAYGKRGLRQVLEEILSPGNPLLDEAENLLRQELREPRTYMSILRALAEGKTRPIEIAHVAKIDPRAIHHYIAVLRELEIIDVVRPLGQKRGAQIVFKDNYYRFWFTYITRLRSLIEAGYTQKVIDIILREIDSYAAKPFEQVVQQTIPELYSYGVIETKPLQVGSWWKKNLEIDIVIREPGKSATFMEVKWKQLTIQEAKTVLEKLEEKAERTGLQGAKNYYVVVTRRIMDREEPITRIDEHRLVLSYEKILEEIWRRRVNVHPS